MRCPRTSPTIRPERSALRDVKLNCRLARGLVLLLELRGAVAPRDATELDHPPTVICLARASRPVARSRNLIHSPIKPNLLPQARASLAQSLDPPTACVQTSPG